jgi:hypothetical protein
LFADEPVHRGANLDGAGRGRATVSTSGGLNNESVIKGIVLNATGDYQLTPGLINGELIGGGKIALASGGAVNGTPQVVPEPPGVVLLALGGFVFALVVVRSPRRNVATVLE